MNIYSIIQGKYEQQNTRYFNIMGCYDLIYVSFKVHVEWWAPGFYEKGLWEVIWPWEIFPHGPRLVKSQGTEFSPFSPIFFFCCFWQISTVHLTLSEVTSKWCHPGNKDHLSPGTVVYKLISLGHFNTDSWADLHMLRIPKTRKTKESCIARRCICWSWKQESLSSRRGNDSFNRQPLEQRASKSKTTHMGVS